MDTWHSSSSESEHIKATISVSGVTGMGQPTRGEDKRLSRECSTYASLFAAMKNIAQWTFDVSWSWIFVARLFTQIAI